jgi:hypothetical protein
MLITARPGRARGLAIVLATGYLVALALLMFWPEHVDAGAGPLYATLLRIAPAAFPFGVDPTLNVVLLIPFGMILASMFPGRPFVILGLAWVVPLLVEISQGVFLPGRTSSAVDVAANTVGGLIGAVGLSVARRLHRTRTPRR